MLYTLERFFNVYSRRNMLKSSTMGPLFDVGSIIFWVARGTFSKGTFTYVN